MVMIILDSLGIAVDFKDLSVCEILQS